MRNSKYPYKSTLTNKSFITWVFPNIRKIAKVAPISLLSNIGKITEKLIQLRLNLFLETRNCYYPFQFGFKSNFSTTNALMSIVANIKTQLASYLKSRKWFTSICNGITSTQVNQTGVPQGSVLRLLLFLLYINYLNKFEGLSLCRWYKYLAF